LSITYIIAESTDGLSPMVCGAGGRLWTLARWLPEGGEERRFSIPERQRELTDTLATCAGWTATPTLDRLTTYD
jgi:hypothetical protein